MRLTWTFIQAGRGVSRRERGLLCSPGWSWGLPRPPRSAGGVFSDSDSLAEGLREGERMSGSGRTAMSRGWCEDTLTYIGHAFHTPDTARNTPRKHRTPHTPRSRLSHTPHTVFTSPHAPQAVSWFRHPTQRTLYLRVLKMSLLGIITEITAMMSLHGDVSGNVRKALRGRPHRAPKSTL